jgi:phosphatidylglycerol:prolipoprotein diacylglycerol transferase
MYIKAGFHGFDVAPLTGFYHPTFFYESMLNLVGFSLMLILRRIKKVQIGEIFAFYLIWYGGIRIFIETMRTDPLTFELFGMTFKSAIVTSSLMILGGILISLYVRIKRKEKNYGTIPGCFRSKKS